MLLRSVLPISILSILSCSSSTALGSAPESAELRGVWIWTASPPGARGGDWLQACSWAQSAGFTAVFPCVVYGPLAWLDMDGLLRAPIPGDPDPIEACLEEAHGLGLEVHAWVVMWKLSALQDQVADSVAAVMQTQVGANGESSDWLCPTDPANRDLEVRIFTALAREYEFDGIQLDYVRFPDGDHCFCDGCRERFAMDSRLRDLQWPRDVYWGGRYSEQWREWRRSQMTSLVRSIVEAIRIERPGALVSAQVIPELHEARESCGQDWAEWTEEGLLDFIVPMDYVSSDDSFEVLVHDQVALSAVPVAPAIGPFDVNADLDLSQVLSRIGTVRSAGCSGFVIVLLKPALVEMLEGLRVD
jgi:uncharacterized lipoprotein YddW (UPF0748 family)